MNLHRQRFSIAALYLALAVSAATAGEIDLYFSPNGGAAAAVVREIDQAKSTIKIQAYAISEPGITRALLAAHDRGVTIGLIVTPTQQSDSYSTAGSLGQAGIPTVVDRFHAIMHNKTVVIDNAVVITGSMNFTVAGDKKNAENTLVIHDAAVAARYAADYNLHLNHSGAFTIMHRGDFKPSKIPPHLILPPKRAHTKE